MALSPGTRLGHYDVTSLLGEGGMGQVWQATDTQLNRQVALKILPDAFAADPDRLARFTREAQILASLNHPNIAAIYGIEQSDDTRALVLELVEGPTLADRISKGPIPIDEALPIAKQIAEALEAAHEAGVIHRDLKPANIKVREDGTVKVLDFGLAKAFDPNPEGDPSQSPTLTAAATQMGVIMGTAAYMSPEQARGKRVDKRADIWAFGCVLYEMLTGQRPFQGEDVSLTLASVMKSDPNVRTLPPDVPATVRTVLRRCLEKNPRERVRDVGDVRLAMEGAFETTAGVASGEAQVSMRAGAERAGLSRLVASVAATALVVGVGTWWATRRAPSGPASPMRVEARLPDLEAGVGAFEVALSPDGTLLVYGTLDRSAVGRGLYLRALDRLEGTLLVPGGGFAPFFSPDGQWVAFFTPTELQKVPVTGGSVQTVASVQQGAGGSWGPDDTIVFGAFGTGLMRVSANEGEPKPLTQLETGETLHGWPQWLPGGRAVLFAVRTRLPGMEASETGRLDILNLETQERTVVQEASTFGRYVPTGHLVYEADGNLFGVPFDLATRAVSGSAVPLASDLGRRPRRSPFSVSRAGTLAYLSDSDDSPEYPVVWVDRQGEMTPLWAEPGEYGQPRLSPDGTRVALIVHRDDNVDLWVYDIERGVPTRVTSDEAIDDDHVWSPDGEYLAFQSDREQPPSVYRVRADGSGAVERLTEGEYPSLPESWSADGRFLTYVVEHPQTGLDIWVLPMDGDREAVSFANTDAAEIMSAVSPDGRWIAYNARSGTIPEVYVRPYPSARERYQVSSGGGTQPRWSGDGRELFYRTPSGVMVVPVDPDADTFEFGRAEELFSGAFQGGFLGVSVEGEGYADYDVTADGQRFVMFPGDSNAFLGSGTDHVTLVRNWFEELKRLVPIP